ncbi:proline dehydrogenase family protein [Microbacterium sp. CPCC 204701]|uniref:proline dehydrogenase family protein n=1 Tax=Microbacterium sp. CPCC 204701 TaxID=2493084 RepID=UPI001F0BAB6F|nr:proline dehydrogenase family protein [Microbacterium sp. CPCC 204701]
MKIDQTDWERTADVLRGWALDEDLKERMLADARIASVARRLSERYIAGEHIDDALGAVRRAADRGHLGSIEYVGESVRSAEVVDAETAVFVKLAQAIGSAGLDSTVSFDLSHVGSVIDPELGFQNGSALARATAPLGTALMVSAEGSDRTDLVLDLYERLAAEHAHVGITLQARLRRTPADLDRVLALPGRVRLVKGAFLEPDAVAHRRDSDDMYDGYLSLADRLVSSGHAVSLATHDESLVQRLIERHGDALRADHVEFEMLMGLGTRLLDHLHADGYRTREYVLFGREWWLYVLNRIAEDPGRLFAAIADLGG